MAQENYFPPADERLRRSLIRRGVPSRDVDDAIQELWIRIWMKADLVHAAREPKAYVAGMMKDVARRYARMASRRREDLIGLGEEAPCSRYPNPEEFASAREDDTVVERLLAQIDERFRDTYLARNFSDQSPGEIAAAFGTPLKTIEKRLRLAQRDIEAAWTRWRLKEERLESTRRRGFAVLFLLWDSVRTAITGLRRWMDRLHPSAVLAAMCLLPGALLTSDIPTTSDGSTGRPRLALSDQADAASAAAPAQATWAASDQPGAVPVATARAELFVQPVEPGTTEGKLADLIPTLRPPTNSESDQLEHSLIESVLSSLKDATPEASARARTALEEHRARFPHGRYAALRERLLHKLR